MAAEVGEMFPDQWHFCQPALDIYAEQFLYMGAAEVEAGCVEIGDFGNTSDRRLLSVHFSVAALKDPLQHSAVFSITRPQELAFLVLAKPVDVEDLRQLRRGRVLTHLEPMPKIVAHVVAAEGKHGHGIAT